MQAELFCLNGLNVRERALVRAWLGLAMVALAFSTVFAVMLLASRTPFLARLTLGGAAFRGALVTHVNLAVLVWFLSFAAALWNLVAPGGMERFRFAGFAMAAAGTLAIVIAPFFGGAPWLANYVPVLASPVFLTGVGWFVVGVTVTGLMALPRMLGQFHHAADRTLERIGVSLSVLPVLMALVSLGWSVATYGSIPPDIGRYENAIWGAGHTLQFTHVVLMMLAWMALARPGASQRMGAVLLVLGAAPAALAPLIHVVYGDTPGYLRAAFTSLMTWGLWPGAGGLAVLLLVHEWRNRKAAHPDPALRVALFASLFLFALGCVFGAVIRGESTLVPAHYHCTIGAVTVAYMGLCYRLLPVLGFRPSDPTRAGRQLAIYASGLVVLAAGLAWSSMIGVPRKTAHAELAGLGDAYTAAMSLAGIGGLLAVIGAAWFIANVGRAVLPQRQGRVRSAGSRRRDVRPRALALTLGLIVASGLLFSLSPEQYGAAVAEPLLPRSEARAHAADKRREEIESRFVQGVAMLHAKQYEHALTAFHRVLELDPEMPEAHVNAGFSLVGLGRYPEARDFFEGATVLRKGQVNAYYGLAVALEGLNDLPGAVGAMRAYVHLSQPEDMYLRKAQAALWEWEEALKKARAGGETGRQPAR